MSVPCAAAVDDPGAIAIRTGLVGGADRGEKAIGLILGFAHSGCQMVDETINSCNASAGVR